MSYLQHTNPGAYHLLQLIQVPWTWIPASPDPVPS